MIATELHDEHCISLLGVAGSYEQMAASLEAIHQSKLAVNAVTELRTISPVFGRPVLEKQDSPLS